MSDHQTYAYFYARDFECSPESISKVLEIEPTHFWCKGERWGPNNIRERKENFWSYRTSESSDDYYTNVHFKELLGLLESRKDKLAQLPIGARIGITYVPTCYYPNVAVILEKELLQRVVALGLALDFDIYSLVSSDE
ncbi:DUF4279 domain-containing protein [Microbulbifer litoralis]|uniref:DUF4279 domain-containing protein n=1 Tax=Microbulbifer litoralis TaxID=2933965 RepID=UPI0020291C6E|nr:DUF4279 domain-containing protein [Microbulbifer sp. GX H0434]